MNFIWKVYASGLNSFLSDRCQHYNTDTSKETAEREDMGKHRTSAD